jgi:hypothetical protein
MSREEAVRNAASTLATFCGRTTEAFGQTCQHDHSGDAEAFVRMVEQHAAPELLRQLLDDEKHSPDLSLAEIVEDKAKELEASARVVPSR